MDSGLAAARRPGMTERKIREASFAPGGFLVLRLVADRRPGNGCLAHVGGFAGTLGRVILQGLGGARGGAAVRLVERGIRQRGRSADRRRELPVDLRPRLGNPARRKLVENTV